MGCINPHLTSTMAKLNHLWSYDMHHSDVIMNTMVSQITSVSILDLTVCSGPDQRNHQSSASLALVRGVHRWLVNSPHKGPVTRKWFPFDDVIMWMDIYKPQRTVVMMSKQGLSDHRVIILWYVVDCSLTIHKYNMTRRSFMCAWLWFR